MTDPIAHAPLGASVIAELRSTFEKQRALAEGAIAQLDDRQLFAALDPESNSIAVVMKHVGGNLRSRWHDVLTTDGEKPDRNRDGEFVSEGDTRETIERTWREGWTTLLEALDGLQPDDLHAEIAIRGERMALLTGALRSLAHTAQHVGQIVYVAKHLRGAGWRTLSIPRGESLTWRPAGTTGR